MNLNKRQQLLAILAIVAVGLFVADKLVFTPLTNNWRSRAERITKLKAQFAEGTETLKHETSWREQWDRMRTNTLAQAKPEAESQMLKAFERWSQQGGVSVSSIRPQWKEAEDDYKTLECRADLAGGLPAISRFLFQIERDPLPSPRHESRGHPAHGGTRRGARLDHHRDAREALDPRPTPVHLG